jgi:serine phosphatase RsbU (regulator of sigma subunit)
MPVGRHEYEKKPFTLHNFDLRKGDIVYSLTDGFVDQFGGEHGKKFKSKQLQALLIQISAEPLNLQKQKLNDLFNDWKGKLDQVDDVTLIGIRV